MKNVLSDAELQELYREQLLDLEMLEIKKLILEASKFITKDDYERLLLINKKHIDKYLGVARATSNKTIEVRV